MKVVGHISWNENDLTLINYPDIMNLQDTRFGDCTHIDNCMVDAMSFHGSRPLIRFINPLEIPTGCVTADCSQCRDGYFKYKKGMFFQKCRKNCPSGYFADTKENMCVSK